jgi:hypothetical protein
LPRDPGRPSARLALVRAAAVVDDAVAVVVDA